MQRLLASSDAEVRARAEKVLRVIIECDFRVRLDAFASDLDGQRHDDLPGWDRYRRALGDGREARALFVAMQCAESRLWDALAARDPSLNTIFAEQCDEVQSLIQQTDAESIEQAVGGIATILFMSGLAEVTVDDDSAVMMETLVHYPAFEQGVRLQTAASAAGKTLRRALPRACAWR